MITTTEPTRKEHILVEAARLFRELGFRAATMRDLAGAVGMEAASLYNHISNKQDLLETICMTIADRYLATLTQAESETTPLEKISVLVKLHISIITTNPHMTAVAHDEWRHLEGIAKQNFVKKRDQYESTLKYWIEEGKEIGQLRAIDTNIMLYTLLSSLQWLHHWFRKERSAKKETIENEMVELLLGGMKK